MRKIVVRLWAMMMLLVAVSILFMWVAQIVLFERNYVDASIQEVQTRLEPIMADLENEDMADNEMLASYLSKSINGKMLLFDTAGRLLTAYSFGHPMEMNPEEVSYIWEGEQGAEKTAILSRGEAYTRVLRFDRSITYEMAISFTYDGATAYAVLYHSLNEVNTVLDINRNQLIVLSIILTIVAAVLAAVLAKLFVKPIFVLKDTVDRLAQGDLEATPGLTRQDELGQLSNSIDELGQALRRVDVLRREVIANVSHEMRSPLSLIIGYAEMVRDLSWHDDVKRGEDLNLIIHEARRMSEMVKDIMDYSQFQAGFMQVNNDWYSLREIVESETSRSRKAAAEYGLVIKEMLDAADAQVYVDALKLSLVVRNLLHNAINHTADGGVITVRADRMGAGIRIAVMNPGEPIPEAEREIIWERYQRGQHHGGRNQGTGIGLSIVRTILQAHNMCYGVECMDGQVIFWFAYEHERKSDESVHLT